MDENKPRIKDDVLMKMFMKKKNKILNSAKVSIAPASDPVWSRIAEDLDNKISPSTARRKAYAARLHELRSKENAKKEIKSDIMTNKRLIAQSSVCGKKSPNATAKPRITNKCRVTQEEVLNVFLKRINEVLRPKKLFVVGENDPVWSSMAKELGNALSPGRLHQLAAQNKKFRKLLFPPKVKTERGRKIGIKEEQNSTDEANELTNEINAMVSEDSVLKLMRTNDSLISDMNNLKKNSKICRKILIELRSLRADLVAAKCLQS